MIFLVKLAQIYILNLASPFSPLSLLVVIRMKVRVGGATTATTTTTKHTHACGHNGAGDCVCVKMAAFWAEDDDDQEKEWALSTPRWGQRERELI